jgi:predicted phosphodiesterase
VKLQLLSDLHLEADPYYPATPAPDADLLVLAGDIGSYQKGSRLAAQGEHDWGLARFSPKLGRWPVPVLFVPGNHEYDGFDIDDAAARLRTVCDELGITMLDRDVLLWPAEGGAGPVVRFIGCTLWSDFDALCRRPESSTSVAQVNATLRDKAMRAADHYLAKAAIRQGAAPFDARAVRARALAEQAWLRARLTEPHTHGPTVVVTHFAPSLKSADPRYGLQPGTAGFCNALDDALAHADLWLHGHLHCPSDYRVGRCRVVANPLGYARKGEQAAHRRDRVIELAA